MKKISQKILTILFILTFLGLILAIALVNELNLYDELWDFHSILKMNNGGIIYTDNNVIITPIFFALGNFLFHILGSNMLVFRIFNTIIYSLKYILLFLILKKFNKKNTFSALYTLCLLLLDFSCIRGGANYNTLSIVFCLLGIFFFVSYEQKKFYSFGQGLIIFLVFFTKQTTGIYYAFGIVLFELIDLGFHKNFFKNQLLKLASFLPCLIISLSIMYFKGNLVNFIDLCFGGIFEFGSSNVAFVLKSCKTIICMVFILFFSIFILKTPKIEDKNFKRNITFFLCIAVSLTFVMYPIVNTYHANLALTFYYLLFLYIIDTQLIQEIFETSTHLKILKILCIIISITSFIKIGLIYLEISDFEHFDKAHPLYNTPISEKLYKRQRIVDSYILERKTKNIDVVVLSYEASLYNIPLGINNREFDIPFVGNFGYNGIQKTIDKISNTKNTEFLIFTEEDDCSSQESSEIREYIMNHFEKNGELLNYSIYINH